MTGTDCKLSRLLDEGAKCAAWMTKILGSGRVPIPVVQTKLYRCDSSVDVEQLSRILQGADPARWDRLQEPPARARGAGGAISGWIYIAAGLLLFLIIFATQRN